MVDSAKNSNFVGKGGLTYLWAADFFEKEISKKHCRKDYFIRNFKDKIDWRQDTSQVGGEKEIIELLGKQDRMKFLGVKGPIAQISGVYPYAIACTFWIQSHA